MEEESQKLLSKLPLVSGKVSCIISFPFDHTVSPITIFIHIYIYIYIYIYHTFFEYNNYYIECGVRYNIVTTYYISVYIPYYICLNCNNTIR